MTRLRQRTLEELQRRNYAQATIDAYIFAVQEISQYFGRSPEALGSEHLHRYQLYLLKEKRLSSSTVEVRISAHSCVSESHDRNEAEALASRHRHHYKTAEEAVAVPMWTQRVIRDLDCKRPNDVLELACRGKIDRLIQVVGG